MNQETLNQIYNKLDTYKDFAVDIQKKLIPIKALAPENGGDGELEKAKAIEDIIKPLCDDIKWYKVEDKRVSCGFRPSLIATKKGKDSSKRLLLVAHTDVVGTGDLKAWDTDPWQATIKDGKIYGRGSEDNNQSTASSILLLKALHEANITPPHDILCCYFADEECLSALGAKAINKNYKDIFQKNDYALVPDGGNKDGSLAYIAEKGVCWLKITITGKQSHGAQPHKGINAHYAAAEFITNMENMYKKFTLSNDIFEPPFSTFEVTKKENNVESINILPGIDVTFFDCRLLPGVSREEFMSQVEELKKRIEQKRKVQIKIELPQVCDANATAKDSRIVQLTAEAIELVHKVSPKILGASYGTIAANFRAVGVDSVVTSKLDDTLHNPNEYCVIDNMVSDAKVAAYVAMNL